MKHGIIHSYDPHARKGIVLFARLGFQEPGSPDVHFALHSVLPKGTEPKAGQACTFWPEKMADGRMMAERVVFGGLAE